MKPDLRKSRNYAGSKSFHAKAETAVKPSNLSRVSQGPPSSIKMSS